MLTLGRFFELSSNALGAGGIFFLSLVSREWKNGSNSSYNSTPFLHSLLTKGKSSVFCPITLIKARSRKLKARTCAIPAQIVRQSRRPPTLTRSERICECTYKLLPHRPHARNHDSPNPKPLHPAAFEPARPQSGILSGCRYFGKLRSGRWAREVGRCFFSETSV